MKKKKPLTSETFARSLLPHVVGDALTFYARQLRQPLTDYVTDPGWRELQAWSAELPAEKRYLLLAFARQSAIDAISNVLGILDGSCGLPGAPDEFELRYAGRAKPLTGDLQDSFLVAVEEGGVDPWIRRAQAERRKGTGRKRRKSRGQMRT